MRIGAIVLAFVIGAVVGGVATTTVLRPWTGPAMILSYESAPDRQEILVLVGLGRLDSINYAEAQEDANSVRVNVNLLHSRGSVPADMKMMYVPIPLQQPLGSRNVLDAAGQPVPPRRR